MIDNRTALIIVALLYFILPLNAWLALRGQRTPALAWWCGGGLASGLGAVLIGLRDVVPDMLSFVVGNTLLLGSLLLRVHALDLDLGLRWRARWLMLAALSFFVVFSAFHALQHPVGRTLISLASFTAAAGVVAVQALQIARRENSANARAIAFVFLLLAAALLLRLLLILSDLTQSSPLERSLSAALVSLAGLLTSIIGHFSYVGLVLDRSLRSQVSSAAEQARSDQNRHLGEQLEQLDRLRSLGVMSAALGHELNQPLTAILTSAQVAQRSLRGGRRDPVLLGTLFAQIASNTQRARQIIEGLRSFLHPSTVRPAAVELGELLRSLLELIEQETRQHGVTVTCEAPCAALRVQGDAVQLSQVLLNVMRNAIEGLQSSARREIRIRCEHREQRVSLCIHDSGPGLAPEVLPRVGTPFFTTKPGGLGMGLSISRAILTQFGGSLSLGNAATGGTVVEIGLPLWTGTTKASVADD